MSLPIITALRQRRDLKESVIHTVIELAHRASIYGVARVSLRYLAWKCCCCKQTIINHLKKLIALKIIRKQVIWIKGNYCEINTYCFLISWDKGPTQKSSSQNSGQTLPSQEREKETSLGEEIENTKKGLRFCTPGSDAYVTTQAKLAKLQALMGKAYEQKISLSSPETASNRVCLHCEHLEPYPGTPGLAGDGGAHTL
jgi:hypothetical protein